MFTSNGKQHVLFLIFTLSVLLTSAVCLDNVEAVPVSIQAEQRADLIVVPHQAPAMLGGAVSSRGDVNGDGLSDLVIGAQIAEGWYGAVYVYFGRRFKEALSGGPLRVDTASPDVAILGSGGSAGADVSSNGDVNGDGLDDIVIGAPTFFPAPPNSSGRVYIVFGRKEWPKTIELENGGADVIIGEPKAGGWLGSFLDTEGDVNGDGMNDILIAGEDVWMPTGSPPIMGEGYLILGRRQFPPVMNVGTDADVIFNAWAGQVNGTFGFLREVKSGGDINGDGYSDMIFYFPQKYGSPFPNYKSGYFVVFGSPSLPGYINLLSSADVRIEITAGDFSAGVEIDGDINGDGFDDILLRGSREISYPPGSGPVPSLDSDVHLFWGRRDFPQIIDVEVTPGDVVISRSISGNPGFGESIATADLNGDGKDEFVISSGYWAAPACSNCSPPTVEQPPGRVFLFKGSDRLPAQMTDREAFLEIVGTRNDGFGDGRGRALDLGGDFNGDRLPDLSIGAYVTGIWEGVGTPYPFEFAAGRAYLFDGGMLRRALGPEPQILPKE